MIPARGPLQLDMAISQERVKLRTLGFEIYIRNLCRAWQKLSVNLVFTTPPSNEMAVLIAKTFSSFQSILFVST